MSDSRAVGNLRRITQRLSAASTKQLPVVIPQITRSLSDCKTLLVASEDARKDSPDGVVLHRFKTHINTLLGHRLVEQRWAAVVLIKACVALGEYAILAKCGSWMRGLLNILQKSDPSSTKKLCIITLTSIFSLTHDHPTLVREITTPSLPVFITACLNSITPPKGADPESFNPKIDLFRAVLHSFCTLVPNHPSIFRTFHGQLLGILGPLLAPTPSVADSSVAKIPKSSSLDPEAVDAAQSLFALLHFTAPKSGSSNEYSKSMASLIAEAHVTIDNIFRAVLEDWQSVVGVIPTKVSSEGHPSADDTVVLPGWSGIYAGCERLCGLLRLIEKFITTRTAAVAHVPVGAIVDLLTRICMVTVPSSKESNKELSNVRLHEEISKDEREALWSKLPDIHVEAVELIESICQRLGPGVKSLHQTFTELVAWVFGHEKYNESVRIASYSTVSTILECSGSGLARDYIKQITPLLVTSCKDILPPPPTKNDNQGLDNAFDGASVDPSKSQPVKRTLNTVLNDLCLASTDLLTTVLSRVPAEYLPRSLRSQLDQTAVLSEDTKFILASVLNPSLHKPLDKAYSSILPFLARSNPEGLEVESILRPRMPAVPRRTDGYDDDANGDDKEQDLDGLDAIEEEVYDEEPEGADDINTFIQANEAEEPSAVDDFVSKTANGNPSTSTQTEGAGIDQGAIRMNDHQSQKREIPTEVETSIEPDSKRQRLGYGAEVLTSPKSSHDATESSVLAQPLGLDQPDITVDSQTASKPTQSGLSTRPEVGNQDVDDDDEEFVVPELTLDQDTEDEDEDE